jgi:hypothetical protein
MAKSRRPDGARASLYLSELLQEDIGPPNMSGGFARGDLVPGRTVHVEGANDRLDLKQGL